MIQIRRSTWFYLSCFLLLYCTENMFAQEKLNEPTPLWAIKANVLSYATATLNLESEIKLSERTSFALACNYNPWELNDNKKIKHLLLQPEVRYWFCEVFDGLFIGAHGHWGKFNVGGIGFTDNIKDHRYQGWGAGGGISVGRHWILTNRWSIEATIGAGYVHMDYSKYPIEKDTEKLKEEKMSYWGPTRLAVNLVYIIK